MSDYTIVSCRLPELPPNVKSQDGAVYEFAYWKGGMSIYWRIGDKQQIRIHSNELASNGKAWCEELGSFVTPVT